jgi:hypothetical protein
MTCSELRKQVCSVPLAGAIELSCIFRRETVVDPA